MKVRFNKTDTDCVEESIQKWMDIWQGVGKDQGGANCSLCKNYKECDRCPIYAFTEEIQCINTPYARWCNHHVQVHGWSGKALLHAPVVKCSECEALAQHEIEFLQDLKHFTIIFRRFEKL